MRENSSQQSLPIPISQRKPCAKQLTTEKAMKKDIRTTITKENLTNKEQIDAIVWKAKQSGMSYGEFAATLTSTSKSSVFEEYAAVLQAFREEQRKIEAAYIQSKKRSSSKRNRDTPRRM